MKTWFFVLTIFILKQFDHHWKLLKTLNFNIYQAGFSTGVDPPAPIGEGSSKFDGGGLKSIHGGGCGGLKCC